MSNPNVAVTPNVMIEQRSLDAMIRYLPGDFAVAVYRSSWNSPEMARELLTREQMIEYEQYLICIRCSRPCAGTCGQS